MLPKVIYLTFIVLKYDDLDMSTNWYELITCDNCQINQIVLDAYIHD